MPRLTVTTEVDFCAAHRVYNPQWTEERNCKVFGGCANPNWHGHNYVLVVTVLGEPDPETGFVIDFRHLKALAQTHVIDDLDHKNVNLEVAWMEGVIPTAENMIVAIWNRLGPVLPEGVELRKLALRETGRSYVEYSGG